eukprot:TRINITY_DN7016_c0_g2_i2.p1 TRINITY_DN7016_c0_g2~~TRINITY_DN7016_c0_g2_i2.p1  ORF type:complete len:300 (-),score=75.71 TRINITY_DN7016_c0_g2_i2:366-1205(-)
MEPPKSPVDWNHQQVINFCLDDEVLQDAVPDFIEEQVDGPLLVTLARSQQLAEMFPMMRTELRHRLSSRLLEVSKGWDVNDSDIESFEEGLIEDTLSTTSDLSQSQGSASSSTELPSVSSQTPTSVSTPTSSNPSPTGSQTSSPNTSKWRLSWKRTPTSLDKETCPDHLLLVVHGIGPHIEKWKTYVPMLKRNRNDLASMRHKPYNMAIEAVEWHSHLHSKTDDKMEQVTIKNLEGLRKFVTSTVSDVFYFLSSAYAPLIYHAVGGILQLEIQLESHST